MKLISPADGGPVYAETDLSQFIAEPWNAASSLFLIVPAAYCLWLIKGNFRTFRFITLASVLLILGRTGSTIYHAFRSSTFFLLLDVLPIQLLTLFTTIYFWVKVLKRKWLIVPILTAYAGIKVYLFNYVDPPLSINLSYLSNGIFLFLPTIVYLSKTNFHKSHFIFISIALFIISLLFRQFDGYASQWMSMGTHWLWHLFSAAGAGFLGYYLYIMKVTGEEKALSEE